jgi:hypothetical protein
VAPQAKKKPAGGKDAGGEEKPAKTLWTSRSSLGVRLLEMPVAEMHFELVEPRWSPIRSAARLAAAGIATRGRPSRVAWGTNRACRLTNRRGRESWITAGADDAAARRGLLVADACVGGLMRPRVRCSGARLWKADAGGCASYARLQPGRQTAIIDRWRVVVAKTGLASETIDCSYSSAGRGSGISL